MEFVIGLRFVHEYEVERPLWEVERAGRRKVREGGQGGEEQQPFVRILPWELSRQVRKRKEELTAPSLTGVSLGEVRSGASSPDGSHGVDGAECELGGAVQRQVRLAEDGCAGM